MSWVYLSYVLSEKLSSYGNGDRIKVSACKSMTCGDSCNTASLSFSNHIGTHIDFPKHFSNAGKSVDDYSAQDFVFSKIGYVSVFQHFEDTRNLILSVSDLSKFQLSPDWEIVIFDFGFWKLRESEDYCFLNPSFHPDAAAYLKTQMPSLKVLLMDSISLNPWTNKELGRQAHKTFLIENDILIVEDADLSELPPSPKIRSLVISPLRYDGADGTPVTVMAQI